TPKHHNPDLMRWELRRVWEVEAVLKPGERHVQKIKRFYLDEDSWSIVAYHGLDQSDNMHHVMYQPMIQRYEVPAPRTGMYILYGIAKRNYAAGAMRGDACMTGFPSVDSFPPNHFTPSSMAGSGLR